MAKNPLIRSYPKRVNKPLPNKSAGILDDYAVRKVVATKEGSITKTPTEDIDIVNKKYVDSEIGANHPHQDVNTTASPQFVNLTLGDDSSANDITISFKTSGNDATIIYDQSLNKFTFGNSDISTSGMGDFRGGVQIRSDTNGLLLGNDGDGDVKIHYDGTNLIINPKNFGTGFTWNYGSLYLGKTQASGGVNGIDNILRIGQQGGDGVFADGGDSGDADIYTSPGGNSQFGGTAGNAGNLNLNGGRKGEGELGSGNGNDGNVQISNDRGNTYIGKTNTTLNIDSNGDAYFVGVGSGLPFAEIYAYDVNDTITISGTGIANKVQVTSFNVNGESNNCTPDHTNDHITIVKAGIYKINVSISVASTGGSSYKVGFGVYKNNGATLFQNCHVHRNLSGGGGDLGSLNITGLIDLSVNDTIELWTWNETNTNNIIIDDITLNLIQIGGT